MRNINRIKPFLEKFGEEWEKNPDLRFGQFLINRIIQNKNKNLNLECFLYNIEDEKLIKFFSDK